MKNVDYHVHSELRCKGRNSHSDTDPCLEAYTADRFCMATDCMHRTLRWTLRWTLLLYNTVHTLP